MAQAIEKNYYVTMLLRLLSEKMPYIVFKDCTSLSKRLKFFQKSKKLRLNIFDTI